MQERAELGRREGGGERIPKASHLLMQKIASIISPDFPCYEFFDIGGRWGERFVLNFYLNEAPLVVL